MTRPQKAEVILLPAIQKLIALLPEVDRADLHSEFQLPRLTSMQGSNFNRIATEPALWSLTMPANGHRWCILAYLEAPLTGPYYLVCTHIIKRERGAIPREELDKALELYRLYRQMGGL